MAKMNACGDFRGTSERCVDPVYEYSYQKIED
jgi:hypothetical protein